MGGNAFFSKLGIKSKRISALEYSDLSYELSKVLQKYFARVHTVQAYHSKIDFGDIDILVSENNVNLNKELLEKELPAQIGAQEFTRNSSIYSYLINGFQFDLILCNRNHFDSSIFYYDYDPAGNLSGKLFHRWGLRLGHDGLTYVLRDNENTYKLGKIEICKDPKKICEFIDLNFQNRQIGFVNQTDIFDWIINSKYFDNRIFDYCNMNHIAKVRDRKRESYKGFMEYIDKYKNRIYDWPLYKEDNLPHIDLYFPECNLIQQINELREKRRKVKELAEKFNGNLVMDSLNIRGKELGEFLGKYRNSKSNWTEFIENNTAEQIKLDYLEFFKSNYENH